MSGPSFSLLVFFLIASAVATPPIIPANTTIIKNMEALPRDILFASDSRIPTDGFSREICFEMVPSLLIEAFRSIISFKFSIVSEFLEGTRRYLSVPT